VTALSDTFFVRLAEMGRRRRTDPLVWLDVWNYESGLRPDAENPLTHALGLSQVMPRALKWLGFPSDRKFTELSAEDQLPWIERLIAYGEGLNGGPFQSAARYFHFNFFPRTMHRGSSPDTIVATPFAMESMEREAFFANQSLDQDRKGTITYADVSFAIEWSKILHKDRYQDARRRLLSAAKPSAPPPRSTETEAPAREIVVGGEQELSEEFFAKLLDMAGRHNTDPLVWLDVWNVESRLRPDAENIISHAQGLNQMLPSTLKGLRFPEGKVFKELPSAEQLDWIEKLITVGESMNGGPFTTAARYYHFNFLPLTFHRGLNPDPDVVVAASDADDKRERNAYEANKILDRGGKGKITVRDLETVIEAAKNDAKNERYHRARFRLQQPPRLPASPAAKKVSDSGSGAGPVLFGLALLAMGFIASRHR
jgi:soluble lytic murein transglycosylase-like protein